MAQTTSSRFYGVRNPFNHIIPIWIVVVFVFLVVCICTMGGLQEGLGKRHLPDTKVNGSLEVTGNTTTEGRSLARAFRAGMTVSTVTTALALTYASNTITVSDYVGGAAQAVTLPAATVGNRLIHYQAVDTAGGTNTLTFTCATGDAYRTGSVLLGTVVGGGNTLVTSAAGNTIVTYTPATAATNFVTKGSQFVFWCVSDGIWEVEFDNSEMLAPASPETVLTGAVAFS